MKNLIIQFASLAFVFTLSFNTATAQFNRVSNTSKTYKKASFEEQFNALVDAMPHTAYTLVDSDIVKVKEGNTFTWDLTCYGNREYVVFAYTEEGFKDLGLYVYGPDGKMVTYGADSKAVGSQELTMAVFQANYYSKGRIVAKNIDSKRSRKKYKVGIIVAYRKL